MGVLAFYSPYPRAGKSTAQRCMANLAQARNVEVRCESFARPIRRFVQDLLHKSGVPYREVPKDALLPGVPGGNSFRDFMIAIGQSLRSVWPDVWGGRLRGEIRSHRDELVVVDELAYGKRISHAQGGGRQNSPSRGPGTSDRRLADRGAFGVGRVRRDGDELDEGSPFVRGRSDTHGARPFSGGTSA